jgi:hypothetical protein
VKTRLPVVDQMAATGTGEFFQGEHCGFGLVVWCSWVLRAAAPMMRLRSPCGPGLSPPRPPTEADWPTCGSGTGLFGASLGAPRAPLPA